MKRQNRFVLWVLLSVGAGSALACEFTAGETKFVEYATCRYGADAIQVIDLPEGSAWEHCVYQLQAFRPETLLAVTKESNGKEILSINNRGDVGNPCYLSKKQCDAALKAFNLAQQ